LPSTPELQQRIEDSGIDVMGYDKRWGRYRMRLQQEDIEKHRPILQEIIAAAHNGEEAD